jgi:biopolymer transport protein TolR
MGAKLGSSGGPIADINVTPLIDVVLVLLVVFMVITPMLQAGLPVDLPIATQTTTVNDVGQHITVSISATKGWWVEQTQIADETEVLVEDRTNIEAALIDAINEEYRKDIGRETARSILIKADQGLEYERVRAVMDTLAKNRMTTLLVATGKEQ